LVGLKRRFHAVAALTWRPPAHGGLRNTEEHIEPEGQGGRRWRGRATGTCDAVSCPTWFVWDDRPRAGDWWRSSAGVWDIRRIAFQSTQRAGQLAASACQGLPSAALSRPAARLKILLLCPTGEGANDGMLVARFGFPHHACARPTDESSATTHDWRSGPLRAVRVAQLARTEERVVVGLRSPYRRPIFDHR